MRDSFAANTSFASSTRPPVFSIPLSSPAPLPEVKSIVFGSLLPPEASSLQLLEELPGVLSLPIQPAPIRVQSFEFSTPADSSLLLPAKQDPAAGSFDPPPSPQKAPKGHLLDSAHLLGTRIQPPEDIIKLQDRLHYVLQPSLETLIARQSLEFPLAPFPFQLQGVAFLYPRIAALLADEMGLGKTMQAITALRMLLRAGEIKNVLLVCPKPLVTNWKREFALWAPELPLAVIEGDPGRRAWQWKLPGVPVKIANYESLCRDAQLVADSQLHFDLVVLDESQRIKNRAAITNQVVCALPRERSWALTGTPVENSPEDLLGIFEFVAPGRLSQHMKPRALGRAAANYVLRRTKDAVLADLPPKLFRDAELELTAEQRETYQMAEDEGVLRLTELGDSATIHHVFELVLRLKQICNFDPATGSSSKLERLTADLEEVAASGHKAIIFSQWVNTLQRLKGELRVCNPLEYHGQIASNKRDVVIEQFRNDPRHSVLLITYGAGGVGLNLQFCSYVFLFDRWWNPAVEDQAINRAHRIGTAGPVTVTRFLTLQTIEERINQVLAEKRELFDTIFSDAARPKTLGLTQQEIFGLFNLRCPHGTIDVTPPSEAT